MKQKEVKLTPEMLERHSKCSSVRAIEELIWNGLDAGGSHVEVRFEYGGLGNIKAIEVADFGSGIALEELDLTFGRAGNSLKPSKQTTPDGRLLHGSEGEGRFKALCLGEVARWNTTYRRNGECWSYQIEVGRSAMNRYVFTEPVKASSSQTGTTVRVEVSNDVQLTIPIKTAIQELTERFAIYLKQYPIASVSYDGRTLDVNAEIEHSCDYPITLPTSGAAPATLSVIEWKFRVESKKLLLCDETGFAWSDVPAGVRGRGIEYTAYLRTAAVRHWHEQNWLGLGEMEPSVAAVVEAARAQLRTHIRKRLAAEATDLVAQWKKEDIYPYADAEVQNPVKEGERDLFNIVAVRVAEHHELLREGDTESKRLTLALVKVALEADPGYLRVILGEALKLPAKEQQEVADLLKRTTFSSIIKAARAVARRLDTIQAFDQILHDDDWRSRLLERTQLHRLLVHELWILGEDYTLDCDDESLRAVLTKHLDFLGRPDLAPDADVKTIEDRNGIPDVMLSRKFVRDARWVEHLVLELKRPSKPLGADEISQIKKYAFTVIKDERFSLDRTKWRFELLGNDLDDYAKQEASNDGLAPGCIYQKGSVSIWVRKWGDILHDAKMRYEFFRGRLDLEASSSVGLEHLRNEYRELMEGRGQTKAQEKASAAQKAPPSAPVKKRGRKKHRGTKRK